MSALLQFSLTKWKGKPKTEKIFANQKCDKELIPRMYKEAFRAKSLQSCLTLCNAMDCSPAGSSVHETL